MANYPEVQAKAQAELDTVIGPDRLPEFADCANLPYINAIISEVLRWQPVLPMGNLPTLHVPCIHRNRFLIYRNASYYDS